MAIWPRSQVANELSEIPLPFAADLRFQAYSTLAYAGRGLCCFIYFAPPVGGCRNAPVDQFGNETPTWHHLQNVNLRFQKLGPTLLQLTSNDVITSAKFQAAATTCPRTASSAASRVTYFWRANLRIATAHDT